MAALLPYWCRQARSHDGSGCQSWGGMLAGVRRSAAAPAMVALPSVAVAQVIPPSEQPGRARQLNHIAAHHQTIQNAVTRRWAPQPSPVSQLQHQSTFLCWSKSRPEKVCSRSPSRMHLPPKCTIVAGHPSRKGL